MAATGDTSCIILMSHILCLKTNSSIVNKLLCQHVFSCGLSVCGTGDELCSLKFELLLKHIIGCLIKHSVIHFQILSHNVNATIGVFPIFYRYLEQSLF